MNSKDFLGSFRRIKMPEEGIHRETEWHFKFWEIFNCFTIEEKTKVKYGGKRQSSKKKFSKCQTILLFACTSIHLLQTVWTSLCQDSLRDFTAILPNNEDSFFSTRKCVKSSAINLPVSAFVRVLDRREYKPLSLWQDRCFSHSLVCFPDGSWWLLLDPENNTFEALQMGFVKRESQHVGGSVFGAIPNSLECKVKFWLHVSWLSGGRWGAWQLRDIQRYPTVLRRSQKEQPPVKHD